MSKITAVIREFLKAMEWQWDEVQPTRYRVYIQGHAARWVSTIHWDEDDSFLECYSFTPVTAPAKCRPAVAEYLTRVNYQIRFGNFEMDYSDGQVCVRTSMILNGVNLTASLLEDIVFANFSHMDHYLPGLMSVIYGKVPPKVAFEEAVRPKEKESDDKDDNEDKEESDPEPTARSSGSVATSRTGRLRVGPRRPLVSRKMRISQFMRYLHLMDQRAHKEKRTCFLVFSRPADSVPSETQNPHGAYKMAQFLFNEKWFAIDIPNTNLHPVDAERIVKERRGFYREAERPDVGVTNDLVDLVNVDPIGKKYIYGDEREAAEDAAYVFYDVWGLTPDAELLVSASAFGDGPSWEKDEPLE